MNTNIVIETLKKEIEKNETAKDVLYMWAMRQRTRGQVTVSALKLRMDKEGYKHSVEQYRSFLALLANLGVGTPEKRSNGQVNALKHVTYTLQSLGKAVLSQDARLKSYSQRASFKEIVNTAKAIKLDPGSISVHPMRISSNISISVTVNGKPVIIPVPETLSLAEISGLIKRLQVS